MPSRTIYIHVCNAFWPLVVWRAGESPHYAPEDIFEVASAPTPPQEHPWNGSSRLFPEGVRMGGETLVDVLAEARATYEAMLGLLPGSKPS